MNRTFIFAIMVNLSLISLSHSASSKTPAFINFFVDGQVKCMQKNIVVRPMSHTFQLISHGRPGELLLNGEWKTASGIVQFFQEGKLLSPMTDQLNIYGCEFGKGQKGLQAVEYLRNRLGISVAASDDITGKDGDWDLEIGQAKDVLSIRGLKGNLQCTGAVGGMLPTDDFDGDGVCNSIDVDDDNDGVLDSVESICASRYLTYPFPDNYLNNNGGQTNTNVNNYKVRISGNTLVNGTDGLYALSSVSNGNFAILRAFDNANQTDPAVASWAFTDPVQNLVIKVGHLNILDPSGLPEAIRLIAYNGNSLVGPDQVTVGRDVDDLVGNWYSGTILTNSFADDNAVIYTFTKPVDSIVLWEHANKREEKNGVSIDFISGCDYYDTDNDGIPNHFDLDSDGDGCPDSFEAGVAKLSGGPATEPGTMQNGNNTGVVTKVTVASNAIISGGYGANGFANTIETLAGAGAYNSTYTYNLAIDGITNSNCRSLILPVFWIYTGAELKNGTGAQLSWKAAEVNVDHYIIQRSLDAVQYIDIAKVATKRNGGQPNAYTFLDADIQLLNKTKVFYRIVAVDNDLQKKTSDIVSVSVGKKAPAITIYPNPTWGKINFSSLKNVTAISIFNFSGAKVKTIRPSGYNDQQPVDISDLPRGFYIVQLDTNDAITVYLKVELLK